MQRLSPVLLASLLLACGDSSGGTETKGSDASSTGSAASTDGASTSSASEVTASSSTDASSTAVPTSGDSGTTTTGDTASSTTGEPAWCYGWESAEGAAYLELHGRDDMPLVDGGQIQLECGGQGLFMFGLYPTFGGFTPPGDQITFDVVVDVEGHNTNPEGHFYSVTESGYYVGCEPIIGGVLGVVPVIPPDNEDVLTLDGLPADFHVVLHTGAGDVVVDLKMTLVAKDDGSWGFCGKG